MGPKNSFGRYKNVPAQKGHLQNLLGEAKHFYFLNDISLFSFDTTRSVEPSDITSPPFKTCFFAAECGHLFDLIQEDGTAQVTSLVLHESSPGSFDILFYAKNLDGGKQAICCCYGINRDDMLNKLITAMLEKVSAHNMEHGLLGGRHRVKMRAPDGTKYHHTIRDIVVIKPKGVPTPSSVSCLVDWSHRWRVRGHWRKCDLIGKDREGHYTVSGFTWVTDHVKGPEGALLVEKKRIITKVKI